MNARVGADKPVGPSHPRVAAHKFEFLLRNPHFYDFNETRKSIFLLLINFCCDAGMQCLFHRHLQQGVHSICCMFSFDGGQQCFLTFKKINVLSWSQQEISVIPGQWNNAVVNIHQLSIPYLCMDDKLCHTTSQYGTIFAFPFFHCWHGVNDWA